MRTIDEMLEAWQQLNIMQAAEEIIENTAEEAIAFNQRQLYTEGIDSSGFPLAPYRHDAYAALKERMNPAGVTDLYLTGAWYKGMYLEIKGDTFEVLDSDVKDEELTEKYGEDIKGLTRESEAEYANTIVNPALANYIRNRTGAT